MRGRSLLLALLLVTFAGCTDDNGADTDRDDDGDDSVERTPDPEPQNVSLEISAIGAYPVNHAFDKETLEVTAGAIVTLTFNNDDQNVAVQHDWVLQGVEGAATSRIIPGESTAVTFTAPEPGDYTYVCSVGDHAAQMSGTLTVTAAEETAAADDMGNGTLLALS